LIESSRSSNRSVVLANDEVRASPSAAPRCSAPTVADNLRTAADDLRGEVVDNCGHYLSEERPREIAASLLELLGD
jgi:pimeloyl-ACP methyl ester carboxylesterase